MFNSFKKVLLMILLMFSSIFLLFLIKLSTTLWLLPEGDHLAFVGSLIASFLTNVGVFFTIRYSLAAVRLNVEDQRKNNFRNTIAYKIKHLNIVKEIIYQTDRKISNRNFGWNEKFEKTGRTELNDEILKCLLPNLRILIENAASVDWAFYKDIRWFVDLNRKYIFNDGEEKFETLEKDINKLIYVVDSHEKRLDIEFENS